MINKMKQYEIKREELKRLVPQKDQTKNQTKKDNMIRDLPIESKLEPNQGPIIDSWYSINNNYKHTNFAFKNNQRSQVRRFKKSSYDIQKFCDSEKNTDDKKIASYRQKKTFNSPDKSLNKIKNPKITSELKYSSQNAKTKESFFNGKKQVIAQMFNMTNITKLKIHSDLLRKKASQEIMECSENSLKEFPRPKFTNKYLRKNLQKNNFKRIKNGLPDEGTNNFLKDPNKREYIFLNVELQNKCNDLNKINQATSVIEQFFEHLKTEYGVKVNVKNLYKSRQIPIKQNHKQFFVDIVANSMYHLYWNSFLWKLPPSERFFVQQARQTLSESVSPFIDKDKIIYNRKNIFILINLQVPLENIKFKKLCLSLRIKIMCLTFYKYINLASIIKICDPFILEINLNNKVSVRKFISRYFFINKKLF